jgi:hypothetical protein
MPRRNPSNIVAMSALSIVSILVLGMIVAEGKAETREMVNEISLTETQKPAPSLAKRVRTALRQKRAAPYMAATVPPAKAEAPVLLPVVNQKDIKANHQKLADGVLRALPSHCRTYLRNFYVRYENVTQRGLGGKTTIMIDGTATDNEFVGLLTHECGHVTHSNLPGSAASGESAFKDGKDLFYNDSPVVSFFAISWSTENVLKKGVKKDDFVSGYAQSDAFEDFAESFAMYILHRPSMRERAKTNKAIAAKLQWMETYLPIDETVLASQDLYKWDKKVPWDVTKLAYALTLSQ